MRFVIRILGVLAAAAATGGIAGCRQVSAPAPQPLPAIHPAAGGGESGAVARRSGRGEPPTERAAVMAVVRRYYTIANRLRHDMDPTALAVLLAPRCPCQAQVQAIRSAAERGERYVDHAQLNALRPTLEGSRRASVLVNFTTSGGGLVAADGNPVTTAAPHQHLERVFRLERKHGSWLIYRIDAA